MYELTKIINYEVTRDLVLESQKTNQSYTVFDDSDILGDDKFNFLKTGNRYSSRISILGDLRDTVSGTKFKVIGQEKVGGVKFRKVFNSVGDLFYLPDYDTKESNSIIYLNVKRYDLLSVNEIIYNKDFRK